MTSSSLALSPSSLPGCLTSHAQPISWLLLQSDTLEVILDVYCESESQSAPMRHVLTHWVSQPACLHLTTLLSELLRTNLHIHLFNVSASCCGTLLRFGRPDSSGISEPISVPSAWFTTLDDIVPTSKLVVFMLPSWLYHNLHGYHNLDTLHIPPHWGQVPLWHLSWLYYQFSPLYLEIITHTVDAWLESMFSIQYFASPQMHCMLALADYARKRKLPKYQPNMLFHLVFGTL